MTPYELTQHLTEWADAIADFCPDKDIDIVALRQARDTILDQQAVITALTVLLDKAQEAKA